MFAIESIDAQHFKSHRRRALSNAAIFEFHGTMSRPRKTQKPAPEICPVCGEAVPPRSLACPECGADHNSGWRLDSADGLDLPEDDFDYDEFVRREFSLEIKPSGLKTIWWITAIVLLLLSLALYLFKS
jgi:hypothetical protein